MTRCDWANHHPLERQYHDQEWGRPAHDDAYLFKMLNLEGMQAGLSWRTILTKMDALCEAFDDFNPAIVAGYNSKKWDALMANPGIIRHRQKIEAVTANALAYQAVCQEFGSLDAYLWGFIDHQPIIHHWHRSDQVPTKTQVSEALSKDLKKRGFKFVGPTTIYAFMQAVGMVNDHLVSCDYRGISMTAKSLD